MRVSFGLKNPLILLALACGFSAQAATFNMFQYAPGMQGAAVWTLVGNTDTTFANTNIGAYANDLQLSVKNTGVVSGTLNVFAPTGANAGDFSTNNNCTSVSPSASCLVTIRFQPSAAGTRTATLSVAGALLPLSGVGVGAAAWSITGTPTTNFGSATVGSYAPNLTVTVKNSGSATGDLAAPAPTGTNASDFSTSGNCSAIAPNGSCTLTVRFLPSAVGLRTATLGVAGTTLTYTGTGTSATPTLVGDGSSVAGACASGATGCTTWNPSDKAASIVLSNGNLTATGPTASASVRAIAGKASGKWYWEYSVFIGISTSNAMAGLGTSTMNLASYPGAGTSATEGWGYWGNNGCFYHNGGCSSSAAHFGPNDIVGMALDADSHTLSFYKNGVLQKTVTGLTATTWYPAISPMTSGTAATITANFGQSNFSYAPPAGYNAGLW